MQIVQNLLLCRFGFTIPIVQRVLLTQFEDFVRVGIMQRMHLEHTAEAAHIHRFHQFLFSSRFSRILWLICAAVLALMP